MDAKDCVNRATCLFKHESESKAAPEATNYLETIEARAGLAVARLFNSIFLHDFSMIVVLKWPPTGPYLIEIRRNIDWTISDRVIDRLAEPTDENEIQTVVELLLCPLPKHTGELWLGRRKQSPSHISRLRDTSRLVLLHLQLDLQLESFV